MNRKQADKLLAALIFDDLDEASKAELLAYLQSDDELRERLADVRMAVKIASDAVQHGPDPVLAKPRLKRLAKLAKRHRTRPTVFTIRRLVAVAAVVTAVAVPCLLLVQMGGGLGTTDKASARWYRAIERGVPARPEGSYEKRQQEYSTVTFDNARGEHDYARTGTAFTVADGTSAVNGSAWEEVRLFAGRQAEAITGGGDYILTGDASLPGIQSWSYRRNYISSGMDTQGRASEPSAGGGTGGPQFTSGYRRGGTGGYGGMGYGGMGGMGGYGGGMAGQHGVSGPSDGYGGMGGMAGAAGGDLYRPHEGPAEGVQTRTSHYADAIDAGGRVDSLATLDVDGDRRPAIQSQAELPAVAAEPAPVLPPQPVTSPSSSSGLSAVTVQTAPVAQQIVALDGKNRLFVDEHRKQLADAERDAAKYTIDADFEALDAFELKKEPPVALYDGTVTYNWKGDVTSTPGQAPQFSPRSTRGAASEETKTPAITLYAGTAVTSPPEPAGQPVLPTAEPEVASKDKLGVDLDYAGRAAGPASQEGQQRVPRLGDIPAVRGRTFRYDEKELGGQEIRVKIERSGEKQAQLLDESARTRLESGPEREVAASQEAVTDQSSLRGQEDETDLPAASRFKLVPVNPWVMTERDRLSTFALDVDTASYTLCRRYIRSGFLPPAGAVRMEEFINYFNYHYPQRANPTFAVHADAAPSPFARSQNNLTLLKIGVKARTVGRDQRKAAHLVIVVDASASMDKPDRLGYVQEALTALVDKLAEVDRVTLITCADQARLHLEAVPVRERDKIREAISAIQPAGSTNLLAGLVLGYNVAQRAFAPKQINHVILCSDGVANVGQTEAQAVLNAVAADRQQGITLTCVGVGYGSYNDAFLEGLANQGDGSYVFLDSPQAQRTFVEQLAATLQTVAKDARIQVDFNPDRVRRYRLIGYENRDIEDRRFRDDTIDAGEVGSGQCSTALYELELIGEQSADRQADLGAVFVRCRDVQTGQIEEISSRLDSALVQRCTVKSDPRFFLAAAAARFAEWLRQSEHAQDASLTDILRVAEQVSLALPLDRDVRELTELIRNAEHLPRAP